MAMSAVMLVINLARRLEHECVGRAHEPMYYRWCGKRKFNLVTASKLDLNEVAETPGC